MEHRLLCVPGWTWRFRSPFLSAAAAPRSLGGVGVNAEDTFLILWDVTIRRTLTFQLKNAPTFLFAEGAGAPPGRTSPQFSADSPIHTNIRIEYVKLGLGREPRWY